MRRGLPPASDKVTGIPCGTKTDALGGAETWAEDEADARRRYSTARAMFVVQRNGRQRRGEWFNGRIRRLPDLPGDK